MTFGGLTFFFDDDLYFFQAGAFRDGVLARFSQWNGLIVLTWPFLLPPYAA